MGRTTESPELVGPARENVPEPSSTASAIFNMVNAILGAGIVSLPYAWAKAGFIMGWILFTATAVISTYSLEILIRIADPMCRKGEIDITSYDALVERVLGEKGRLLILGSQFLYAYGILVGYIVILRDVLPVGMQDLTHAGFFKHGTLFVAILAVCLLLPMCCLRSVAKLSKISFICFCTAFILIGLVAYELVKQKTDLCKGHPCEYAYTSWGKTSMFEVFGIFVFTKTCHHTEFQIYRSLGPDATPNRWGWITRISIIGCSLITSSCAMVVYGIFGQEVESDFFKSFWKDSTPVSIGRLMFGCVIVTSFPMQLFVAREVMQILLLGKVAKQFPSDNVQDQSESETEDDERDPFVKSAERQRTLTNGSMPRSRTTSALDRRDSAFPSAAGGAVREDTSAKLHYSTTFILFATVLGIGSATDSLGAVLNLVGGVAGSVIGFLLPGLVGYYSFETTGIPCPGGRYLALSMAVIGVAVIGITSVFTFV
ncbi:Vacuolar amino acid transporter 2 [Diplonema papillatum]|nr:Vacuolar amino acid transporter 2 [Diplonema papillatum]|eukprot:gene10368-15966_t